MTEASIAAAPAWNDDLATGVPMLDQQHQALFFCVAELERAATERTMLSTFHAMEQLSRYAREHFAAEERLMRMGGYPDIEEHIEAHDDFRHRLVELRRSYLDHDISTDLIALLRAWLEAHVQKTDMDYVPYLARMRNCRRAATECQEEAR